MGFEHVHRLRVRYSECDKQGHVFNANWLMYFDVTLTELWREALGPWDDVTARGIDLVVAEANVAYRSPGRFDDEIEIAAAVERIGTSSIVTTFDARRDGTHLVTGRMVHVCVDTERYAKKRVPDWVRAALV